MQKRLIVIGAMFTVLVTLSVAFAQRLDQIRTPYDLARYEPSGAYLQYSETLVYHPDGSVTIVPPRKFMDSDVRRKLERGLRALLREHGTLPEPRLASDGGTPAAGSRRKEGAFEVLGKRIQVKILSGEDLAAARAAQGGQDQAPEGPKADAEVSEEEARRLAEAENARRLEEARRRARRTVTRDVVVVGQDGAVRPNATGMPVPDMTTAETNVSAEADASGDGSAPSATGRAVGEDGYVQGEEE